MFNSFNPLNWISAAQDWFSKTERSSGFRPYLIFLILTFGFAIILLSAFNNVPYVSKFALSLIGLSVISFIILYFIKSIQDPDFCRSESHIEKLKQIEREQLGSDIEQLDAETIEKNMIEEAITEQQSLAALQNEEE